MIRLGVSKKRLILLCLVVLAVVMFRLPTVDAVTGSEWISVNSYSATYQEWNARIGASPYLDAQDHPTNYISENKDELMDEGWFGFPDTTLTGTLTVNVSIWGFSDDSDDGVIVFVDETGSGSGSNMGTLIMDLNTGSYKTLALGEYTVSEINLMRIFLRTTDSLMDDIEIDHMRLGVSGEAVSGTDYTAYPDGDLTLTGSPNLISDFVKALVEGFTLIGTTSIFGAFIKALVEGFTLIGTTNIFVIIQKIIAEGFSLTGGTSLAISFSVLLTTGFVLAGVTSLVVNFSVKLVSGFSLGGSVALAVSYIKNLVEGFSLAGTVSAFKVFLVNLIESFSFGVGVTVEKIAGTVLIGSMFFQLFFSDNMWGYIGPVALVIGGYFITNKEKALGIFFIIVDSLIIATYLSLIEVTPSYWWPVIILLLGELLIVGKMISDR